MAVALMLAKATIIFMLCRFFTFRRGTSIKTAALMAQGSEFAFIMFALAAEETVLPKALSQTLMVMVTMTMALTPLVAALGEQMVRWMERRGSAKAAGTGRDTADLDNHVIVAGYGRLGQMLVKLLCMEKINFVAIDLDPRHVADGRKENLPVFYGNARRDEVLEAVGIERAQMIVFTFSGTRDVQRSIQTIRRKYPNTKIVVRAMDRFGAQALVRCGADVVVRETLEAGLNLGGAVLRARGTPGSEVSRVKALFREKFAVDLEAEAEPTDA
jgi:CPA2 family monovalent cation:H+ antiporter-2